MCVRSARGLHPNPKKRRKERNMLKTFLVTMTETKEYEVEVQALSIQQAGDIGTVIVSVEPDAHLVNKAVSLEVDVIDDGS